MTASFDGFPKDFLKFFSELSRNNNREWFQENKERYNETVKKPLLQFIEAIDVPLGRISDCFVADPRPMGGSMFRIYRDVRFGKDKTPYKEHAACQFRHMAGKDAHAPGFYVHLSPGEIRVGGGIWVPPGPQLRLIRAAIMDDPEGWKKATRSPAFRRRFGEIRGDKLKRPPAGTDPDHPLVEDLKHKSFFAMQPVAPKVITSKAFLGEVVRAFKALSPFMEFLTRAEGLSYSLDE